MCTGNGPHTRAVLLRLRVTAYFALHQPPELLGTLTFAPKRWRLYIGNPSMWKTTLQNVFMLDVLFFPATKMKIFQLISIGKISLP